VRALVTGGAGFLGSTLVDRLLAEGHAVDVVDDLSGGTLANLAEARADRHHALKIHRLDVRAPELIDLMVRRPPEVVFHLAARTGPRPLADAVADHVGGAVNVLEAARASEARKVVVASSVAVYGPSNDLPLRENEPMTPRTAPGLADRAVLEWLEAYRDLHQLEFTALALSTVYGPRQSERTDGDDGLVADLVRRALAGEAARIAGGPERSVDLVHVDDAVDAFVRAGEWGGGLLVDIGSGLETTLGELHQMVAEEVVHRTGRAVPTPEVERLPVGVPDRMAVDHGRAVIQLAWRPFTPLSQGIASVVDHLLANGSIEDPSRSPGS
jgi:UDP-glucose 4-epimerase